MVAMLLGSIGEDFLDASGPRAGVVKAACGSGEIKKLTLLFVSKTIAEITVRNVPVAEAEAMVERVSVDSELEAGDVSGVTVLGVLPLPVPENDGDIWRHTSFPFICWWELNIFKHRAEHRCIGNPTDHVAVGEVPCPHGNFLRRGPSIFAMHDGIVHFDPVGDWII